MKNGNNDPSQYKMVGFRERVAKFKVQCLLPVFFLIWVVTYWVWSFGIPRSHLRLQYRSTRTPVGDNNGSSVKNIGYDNTTLKVMTWNLQGLLLAELEKRTEAVISIIYKENPDAIFFQELIPSSHKKLAQSLKEKYDFILGSKKITRYFTGIFYRRRRLVLKKHQVNPFENSVMDRTLVTLEVSFDGVKLALLTTHLESIPDYRSKRVQQLKQSLEICASFSNDYNVLFGGDLNLEQNEDIGLVPDTITDLWEECGSTYTTKFTWDYTKNKNDYAPGPDEQLKRRFDRLYFRSSTPASLKLENFKLIGKDQVEGSTYFPSDHWAIVSTFNVFGELKQNMTVCTTN